jgi:hypothetical protein
MNRTVPTLFLLAAFAGCAGSAAPRPAPPGEGEGEPETGGSTGTPTGGKAGGGSGGTGGGAPADAAATGGSGGGSPDAMAVVPADAAGEDAGVPIVADAGNAGDAGMTLPMALEPAKPIGEGWIEIFPTYKMDQPPGQNRHTITDGEFHLWLFNNDASTYPGRDSGPRSELHIRNNYSSGQAQYQADIKIDTNCSGVSVMQVFGGSSTATGFMAFVTGNNLTHYSSEVIVPNIRGRWFRLNVLHDTATRQVQVYVDGQRRAAFQDHGPATHYFKCGLYHQRNMTARCDAWFKNFHIFKK